MNRDELKSELRKICVAHQGGLGSEFTGKRCDQCDSKMYKIMKLVDAYAESLPVPELMGAKEISVLTGVTVSRVGQYAAKGRIPVVQTLAMGPVFRADDARKFAAIPRKSGNPTWQKKSPGMKEETTT